jgi:hypothetical protein
MAKSKLGLNDRIVFNRGMIKHMSGKDLPLVKIKQIFNKPKLEDYDKWIKGRIEFQTGIGKSEKIKNTENFDSSDEDEYKIPHDPYGLKKQNTTDEDEDSEGGGDQSPKSPAAKRNQFLKS